MDFRKITAQARLNIFVICCLISMQGFAFEDCHALGRLGEIFVDQGVSMESLRTVDWMKATSLMALVSLSAPATDVPTQELRGILFSAVRAAENGTEMDLKGEFQEWRIKNRIPFQFLFPEEVKTEILALKLQGKISRDEEQIQSHGFILELAWNLMVANNKFPIMDPHDVINHSVQFLIPGYSEAFKEKAEVTAKWLQRRQNKINPIIGEDIFDQSWKGALNRALYWNMSVTRSHTYENLPVIHRSGKEATLAVLGNAGSSIAIESFNDAPGLHNRIVDALLGRVSPFSHLSSPDVGQFFRTEPKMQQQMELLLKKVGESEPSRSQIKEKLLAILKSADTSGSNAVNRVMATTKIMQAFAKASQEDPQLADFFNTNNRIELLRLSTSFMDKFLTWKELKRRPAILRYLFRLSPRMTSD